MWKEFMKKTDTYPQHRISASLSLLYLSVEKLILRKIEKRFLKDPDQVLAEMAKQRRDFIQSDEKIAATADFVTIVSGQSRPGVKRGIIRPPKNMKKSSTSFRIF